MGKLAIIHTTPVTIAPLKALAGELLPGWEVVNIMDDSILPQLAGNGGETGQVAGRLVEYARAARDVGAYVILEACSSVGQLVPQMRDAAGLPVVRIDDAMAEEAVRRGPVIGAAATLPTTLAPTVRLLEEKARAAEREVTIQPLLVHAAYERLLAGDPAGHDEILAGALLELAHLVDVVVLAQASMARVVDTLPPEVRERFLSSPRLAMEQVRQVIAAEGML